MKGRLILDSRKVKQKLQRMALQIHERNHDQRIILVGIQGGGFQLTDMLAAFLEEFSGKSHVTHAISINKLHPLEFVPQSNLLAETLKGAVVILVDDVQNSGRTMMYAIRHFLQFEVQSIQTCVLVDRGHNQFPVHSDFVGLSLSTTLQNHVTVEFSANEAEVYLG